MGSRSAKKNERATAARHKPLTRQMNATRLTLHDEGSAAPLPLPRLLSLARSRSRAGAPTSPSYSQRHSSRPPRNSLFASSLPGSPSGTETDVVRGGSLSRSRFPLSSSPKHLYDFSPALLRRSSAGPTFAPARCIGGAASEQRRAINIIIAGPRAAKCLVAFQPVYR